jgi:hypothetical protein
MSESEREEQIRCCGRLMEAAMARYEASNDLSDRGEADRYRLEMEALIKGRSRVKVFLMEAERGLAA